MHYIVQIDGGTCAACFRKVWLRQSMHLCPLLVMPKLAISTPCDPTYHLILVLALLPLHWNLRALAVQDELDDVRHYGQAACAHQADAPVPG